ncbi:hypothetical protein EV715DRAFT_295684 [Schizophyllum commune]
MSLDEYAERYGWEAGGAYLLNRMKDLEGALSKRAAQLEDGLPTTDDQNAADGAGAREMRDLLEDIPTARLDDWHAVHDAREELGGGDRKGKERKSYSGEVPKQEQPYPPYAAKGSHGCAAEHHSARSRVGGDNGVSLSPHEAIEARHGRAREAQNPSTQDVRGPERRGAAALSSPRNEPVDAEATRAGQGVDKEGLDAAERVSRGSGGHQDEITDLHPFGVAGGAGRAKNVTEDEDTAAASFGPAPSACEVDAGLVGYVEGESRENVEEQARSIGNGRRHVALAEELAGVNGSIATSSSSPIAFSSSATTAAVTAAAHCNDPITELSRFVKATAPSYFSDLLEGTVVSNNAIGATDGAAGTTNDMAGVAVDAAGATDDAVEVTNNVAGFTNDTAGAAISKSPAPLGAALVMLWVDRRFGDWLRVDALRAGSVLTSCGQALG